MAVAGFTLIELLCTIAIIAILISLLLPALSQGKAKVQRVNCVSNLHQGGVAQQGFALAHDDKFPQQVSTNSGGSAEFLQAGYNVGTEFYFSFRHFQPLAGELESPKVLTCPSDTRQCATNFAELKNENLSYFISGNPEFGRSDSLLSGDRNVTAITNSIARLGGALLLRWTEELHRLKGNVLFADGHIEEMNGVLGLTNVPSQATTIIIVPTTPSPAAPTPEGAEPEPAPAVSSQYGVEGNVTAFVTGKTNVLGLPELYLTNFSAGPLRSKPRNVSVASANAPAVLPLPFPANVADGSIVRSTNNALDVQTPDETDKEIKSLQAVHRRVLTTGKRLVALGWQTTHRFPWFLIVILLIALMELVRRRMRNSPATTNQKRSGK